MLITPLVDRWADAAVPQPSLPAPPRPLSHFGSNPTSETRPGRYVFIKIFYLTLSGETRSLRAGLHVGHWDQCRVLSPSPAVEGAHAQCIVLPWPLSQRHWNKEHRP